MQFEKRKPQFLVRKTHPHFSNMHFSQLKNAVFGLRNAFVLRRQVGRLKSDPSPPRVAMWPKKQPRPFSEYRLRLGIGIMIEEGIKPKSAEAVKKWIWNGGKLKAS